MCISISLYIYIYIYIAEATKPNVSLDPSCMHEHDSAYTAV